MKKALAACVVLSVVAALAVADYLNRESVTAQGAVALPEVQTKTVTYKDGDAECEGFAAWDASLKGTRPVVLVVHDWMGRGEYDETRARQLAELGYLAFSIDVYGKDVRPTNRQEAGAAAGKWRGDTAAFRTRLKAGMDAALALENADKSKVAILGYCFGGTAALELARSGADIDGAISFHGGLVSATPDDAKNIKGKILVLHGADDKIDTAIKLHEEMKAAKVDYQIVLYGHAVHSFTNPKAGNDPSTGNAYDEKADRRSWEDMKDFLAEALK
jgi:dienelactone hydrolase